MTATTQTAPAIRDLGGRRVVSTKVTSQDPPMEGRHTLRIEAMVEKETGAQSKNPGTLYLNARLRIIDGPDRGKAVFQNFQLEGGFRFLFEDLCMAVGLANRDDVALEDFHGLEFDAEIKHSTFNERVSGELKKIYIDPDLQAVAGGGGAASAEKKDASYPF